MYTTQACHNVSLWNGPALAHGVERLSWQLKAGQAILAVAET